MNLNEQPTGMAPNATRLPDFFERATTANRAAAMIFPKISEHLDAFWEEEEGSLGSISHLNIRDLVDEYWALSVGPLGTPEAPTVFVSGENQFRRYSALKGLYEPVSEGEVVGQISSNLARCINLLPVRLNHASFIALRNRHRLKSVVDRAKDLLAADDKFFQNGQYHVALTNGVLDINRSQFHPSEPSRPVRETLPVKYDPEAKSETFLKAFLEHILERDDIDLLQRYLSQVLEGINHSQTILILTGDSGWGKSSLMKMIGSLVGWGRVGIIREQLFRDEFELAHYAGKNFLFHPDMPTDFLHRKEASLFKQLCGDDPMWANTKGDDGRMVLQGNFPIILACNGKPKIHIDSDTDAWMRRLVVLSFKTPSHERHLGKMAEMILNKEASGILNWLLEGRTKLFKTRLQLTQTPEQKSRTASLLLGSESPSAFVRACLEKQKDSVIGTADLYAHYQNWCKDNHLPPFPSKIFSRSAKAEIETTLGLKYRHDLAGENGKPRRGWKGLALIEKADSENNNNASEVSAA